MVSPTGQWPHVRTSKMTRTGRTKERERERERERGKDRDKRERGKDRETRDGREHTKNKRIDGERTERETETEPDKKEK